METAALHEPLQVQTIYYTANPPQEDHNNCPGFRKSKEEYERYLQKKKEKLKEEKTFKPRQITPIPKNDPSRGKMK